MQPDGRLRGYLRMDSQTPEPLVPGGNPDPASPDHATITQTDDARAGVTLGRMRWVLIISFAAAAIAFVIAWLAAVRA
jgi:hypothetical protein